MMIKEIDKQIALEYLDLLKKLNQKIELSSEDSDILDEYIFALDAYREGQFVFAKTLDQIVYYFQLKGLSAFNLSNLRRMNLI